MQTKNPPKTKPKCSETSEISTLKKQIADIQAQVADMKTASNETKNNSQEAAEMKTLKQ